MEDPGDDVPKGQCGSLDLQTQYLGALPFGTHQIDSFLHYFQTGLLPLPKMDITWHTL